MRRARTMLLMGLLAGPAAALALPAAAFDLGPEAWARCLGRTACDLGPVRLEAGPAGAALAQQVDAGRGRIPALGVDLDPGNGFNEAEIQGPVGGEGGELLHVVLAPPQRVLAIDIAYLFNPEHIGADPAEAARIEGFAGGRSLGTVEVVSVDDSTVRASGPVAATERLSAVSGVVRLTGLFGGAAVEALVFTAPPTPEGDSSDYAVARIETAAP